MAWEGSTRKERLPKDWQARRIRVLRRDAYTCQERNAAGVLCGARASEVDHVVAGDDHRLSNLRAICRWHHAKKSGREGQAGRMAKSPPLSKYRPAEKHPGMS